MPSLKTSCMSKDHMVLASNAPTPPCEACAVATRAEFSTISPAQLKSSSTRHGSSTKHGGTCNRLRCSRPGRMRLMPAERRFDVCDVSVPAAARQTAPTVQTVFLMQFPHRATSDHQIVPLRSNRIMILLSAAASWWSAGGGRAGRRHGTTLLCSWPAAAADAAPRASPSILAALEV